MIFQCKFCNSEIVSSYKKVFCNSSCSAKYNNTNRTHTLATKEKISKTQKSNYQGACRDQTKAHRNVKDITKWVLRACKTCGTEYTTNHNYRKYYCSRSCFPAGGLRIGSGRGIKCWYNGMYLRSSYELMFVKYCESHNINVLPCPYVYSYEWEGKIRKYYPDFIIDNVVYEIKGYHTPQVDAKTSSVTDRVICVLYKSDLDDLISGKKTL